MNKKSALQLNRGSRGLKLDKKLMTFVDEFSDRTCWVRVYEEVYKPVQKLVCGAMTFAIRAESRKQLDVCKI